MWQILLVVMTVVFAGLIYSNLTETKREQPDFKLEGEDRPPIPAMNPDDPLHGLDLEPLKPLGKEEGTEAIKFQQMVKIIEIAHVVSLKEIMAQRDKLI